MQVPGTWRAHGDGRHVWGAGARPPGYLGQHPVAEVPRAHVTARPRPLAVAGIFCLPLRKALAPAVSLVGAAQHHFGHTDAAFHASLMEASNRKWPPVLRQFLNRRAPCTGCGRCPTTAAAVVPAYRTGTGSRAATRKCCRPSWPGPAGPGHNGAVVARPRSRPVPPTRAVAAGCSMDQGALTLGGDCTARSRSSIHRITFTWLYSGGSTLWLICAPFPSGRLVGPQWRRWFPGKLLRRVARPGRNLQGKTG